MNTVLWDLGRAFFIVFFGLFKRLRRRGTEHIPATGPVLIVCNHLSLWDPPLVGTTARPRRTYFMAKSELFRLRAFGWLIGRVGAFPVERGGLDRDAIRMAREILRRGDAMVMFPEGTRSLSGNLRPFFPGAALMAFEPGVRVVPAAVWGSQRRFGPITVVFGPPVDLASIAAAPRGERNVLATEAIAGAIAGLVEQAGGPPQRIPEGKPSLERY